MKTMLLKGICILFSVIACIAMGLFVYVSVEDVSSGGFLDLTNLAQGVFLAGTVVSGVIAGIVGWFGWKG